MTSSLVGSEMCIRDSNVTVAKLRADLTTFCSVGGSVLEQGASFSTTGTVSYTHLTLPTICSV
eukprot:1503172-Prorocentrum_lima.AAC.1